MPSINKLKVGNTLYDLYGTGGDVLPVGTEIDIAIDSDIPDGWEEVDVVEKISADDFFTSFTPGYSVRNDDFFAYRCGNVISIQRMFFDGPAGMKNNVGKTFAEINSKYAPAIEDNWFMFPTSYSVTAWIGNDEGDPITLYVQGSNASDQSTDLQFYGVVYIIKPTTKRIRKTGSMIATPYELVEDTGWIDLVIDDTIVEWRTVEEGGVKPADYYKPQIRRIGKQVYMKGQIKWTTDNVNTVFVTIQEEFRPSYEIRFVQGMWLGISGEIKTVGYDQMYSPPASDDKTTLAWVSIASNWVVD